MLSRLDLAATKGCDGVDPDNVDGYDNDNGLGLTLADAVDHLSFQADVAFARKLSVGLKKAGEIVPQVLRKMQWAMNEQCVQYGECGIGNPSWKQESRSPMSSIRVERQMWRHRRWIVFGPVRMLRGLRLC